MNFLIILLTIQVLAILSAIVKLFPQKFTVNLLRFSYAIFLLFSGLVKLIDPLGFSYKLQEYFEVFGFDFLVPASLMLSISIILFELFLGLFLFYGIHIRKVMWGNLLLMVFFTFLTFFSAYFNKVTDCGCFGDFMKLDPWTSFFKDIYLLFISLTLFFTQDKINLFLHRKTVSRLLIIKALILFFIPINALSHLPFIDFRAYKIGVNISEDRKLPQDAKKDVYQDVWYYELNGVVQEFETSDEPWKISGATFKDRKTKLIIKGDEPKIHDFDIIDAVNDLEMTDSILSLDQVLLVISYDIQKTNVRAHGVVDAFVTNVLASTLPVYGLSSSSTVEVKNKLSQSELLYPYFLVDQTTLKTMIRANPGVFLLRKGIVQEKWHWRDLPDNLEYIIN